MSQQDEVRHFLGSRRARLTPDEVGLPPSTGRRRVAGLRRDEVAVLAGVSSEYYARLERGNLAGASDAVLAALAAALRLDDAERQHLHNLARAASPSSPRRRTTSKKSAAIREPLLRILDAMSTTPAHLYNSRADIVGSNALARELLLPIFDFARTTQSVPNSARFTFLDPAGSHFYPDWGLVSRDVVAALHAAVGHDPYDKSLTDLIGELSSRSTAFRTLWATHDVRVHRTGIKRMRHPDVGLIELEFEVLQVSHEQGLVLVVFTAAPGSAAADSLALLSSLAASRTGEQIAHP